ncbi:nucleotidyltransferase family protein [Zhongshania aliphaticivorans]|uniref:nucleotidyltransferase family protein n=1 Tax=Zhongshania aliphaticivorans TaxID=1470434 RepID=UPI0012E51272|nr:nucleotidyltransferase family protein [Zhongshania aliphaticivorans]CAA0079765.1 Purine catabolism protein PucB [Zhongshania aliphaticivorans]
MTSALIIMAAGKSRRFGEADKRFTVLPHGGVLINALVRRGRKAGLDVSVVLDSADDVSAQIDAPCIFTPNAEQGMGASIADAVSTLMQQSKSESLLIMPADLPLLRVESIRRVAARAASNRIVIPQCAGRRGHPVAFGRQFWPALSCLGGDEGARSVISAASSEDVDIVALDDEGIYLDADTSEQMFNLLEKLRPVLR